MHESTEIERSGLVTVTPTLNYKASMSENFYLLERRLGESGITKFSNQGMVVIMAGCSATGIKPGD